MYCQAIKCRRLVSQQRIYLPVFSSDELNNWNNSINNFKDNPAMGMALLFQNVRIQLLPITRLESLKEFWSFAIKNNYEKLAYDVSRNLIETIEPSIELSEYSISIARAHIFNRNFQQAEKWILFYENYITEENEVDKVKLNKIKFLFNIKKSINNDTFIKNLENDLMIKIENGEILDDYSETLKTIFGIILNEKKIITKIKDEKKIIDNRLMPSNYIINTLNDCSKNNKIGQLILASLVSLDKKTWNEVHPQHIKILLESFKNAKLNNIFKDLIIEIFEESKII